MQRPASDADAYVDVALRLTAIALLLRPMGPWFVRPMILALAVVVLIVPRALRHPLVWAGVGLLIALRIASDWPLADNHIYLLCYWSLAVALALRTSDASRTLAFTSRWLVGLAFAFAVLWKAVLAPDFLDGRFFRVTLLTDPRFDAVVQLIGGLSQEQLDANREALVPLPHGAELLDPPVVHEPARLRALASVSTFGILALEAAVALSMMGPTTRISAILRHATLLSFCGITYAFAPVAGFGWLLIVMGLAQLAPQQVWLGRAYVAMFLAVLFYGEVHWAELALDLVR
ncbi:MAG TPA: hypothetical protein VFB92_08800 [Vicinamibacterales bacterium]|nr:hypothetical protein [Vicinamibacterales bacterium]